MERDMDPKTNRLTIPLFFNIALLFTILIAFRTEITATGARILIHFFPDTRLEFLLGNYYRNAALLNHNLANHFYTNVMQNDKTALPNASEKDKAMIQYTIGHLYFCGKGVSQDFKQAKHWFGEADKSFNQAIRQHKLISPELGQMIEQGFSLSNRNVYGQRAILFCEQEDSDFTIDVLMYLYGAKSPIVTKKVEEIAKSETIQKIKKEINSSAQKIKEEMGIKKEDALAPAVEGAKKNH